MLAGIIIFRLNKKFMRDADVKRILAKRMFAIKLTMMRLRSEFRKKGKDQSTRDLRLIRNVLSF